MFLLLSLPLIFKIGGRGETRTHILGVKSTLLGRFSYTPLVSLVGHDPTVDGLKIRCYARLASG